MVGDDVEKSRSRRRKSTTKVTEEEEDGSFGTSVWGCPPGALVCRVEGFRILEFQVGYTSIHVASAARKSCRCRSSWQVPAPRAFCMPAFGNYHPNLKPPEPTESLKSTEDYIFFIPRPSRAKKVCISLTS